MDLFENISFEYLMPSASDSHWPCGWLDDGVSSSNNSTNFTTNACLEAAFSNFKVGERARSKLESSSLMKAGLNLFTYVTPVVIVIGLVGNGLSIAVFRTSTMRKMSASVYLAALAMTDICTLLVYVLVEWLRRGLPYLAPGLSVGLFDLDGICQMLLYLAYITRFMSSWIIVTFTAERVSGVCYPLQTMHRKSKRILVCLLVTGALFVIYKPFLSGEYKISERTLCTSNPDHIFLSFVLDTIYVTIIFFLPLAIITTLNLLIVRTLYLRNRHTNDLFAENTKIRLEFTIILFAISFFYITFHMPYFVLWCKLQVLNGPHLPSVPRDKHFWDYWISLLNIARTVFYLNYCSNFFLYCITGTYFRNELRRLFCVRKQTHRVFKSHIRSSQFGSVYHSSNTHVTSYA
ncbi:P2RY1-like protein [Mya arenaria]|uniref:P2RY1-like protein n=2 Tax=Mya arenaria TaxID=6604 RepID=A0ABY7F3Q6_MYAAR|nr:P2RY1-like protein [Mya arenaria]